MKKLLTSRPPWIALGYLGITLIATLSLLPASFRPHSGLGGQYEHFIAYALVGGALGLGYRTIRLQLISLLVLIAVAAMLEVLQNLIPGRNPELFGFLASSLGACFGLALVTSARAFLRAIAK